jgi:hypothetical protein
LQDEVKHYLTRIRDTSLVPNTTQLVSIHVRRDDYKNQEKRLVDVDFFRRAIAALKESLDKSSIGTDKVSEN